MIKLQNLTQSRLAKYRKCPRAHAFAYEYGLRKVDEGENLRIGSGVHEGLDYLAQTGDVDAARGAVQRYYKHCPSYIDRDAWLVEEQIAMCLVIGYEWRWRDDGYEVLETEQEFRIPILNPETNRASRTFKQAGKMDKIVRLPNGEVALMEHKTTGEDISPDSRYWKRLKLDTQITSYLHAARTLGYPITQIVYDVIRKPATRPNLISCVDENGRKIVLDEGGQRVYKKDGTPRETSDKAKGWELRRRRETPQEYGDRLMQEILDDPHRYYARQPVLRLDGDVDQFKVELWRETRRIREDQIAGVWPMNAGSCERPYPCEYFELCTSGVTNLDDGIPEGFTVLQDKHPELA